MAAQLPVLAHSDIDHVAAIILQMNAPENAGNADLAKALQKQLQEIQRTDQAWGLTEGLLRHPSPIVRFFGASTAQVKISRDWDSLPTELQITYLNHILTLTSQAASPDSPYCGNNGIVLRKLFSCLAGLILRLTPTIFPDPLVRVITTLSGHGVGRVLILEWAEIAIRDISRGALVEPRKSEISRAITAEMPLVVRSIMDALSGQGGSGVDSDGLELTEAFKCLEAWIDWGLGSEDINQILPILYMHLNSSLVCQAISAITEILTASIYRDGKATKLLTEPLLEWFGGGGAKLVALAIEDPDNFFEELVAVANLIEAIVEHSANWMASRVEDPRVQNFFRILLDLTGFPGVGGADETTSERMLMNYALIQEAITDAPEFQSDYETSPAWNFARGFFREATVRIRRKLRYPDRELTEDEREAFEIYRRDAGEVMVTAYYVVRDDQLREMIENLVGLLQPGVASAWQDVEAALQCLRYSSEAVPLSEERYLSSLLSNDVFSRLPLDPASRVPLAALALIRAYEEWFKFNSANVVFALDYIVAALDVPTTAPLAATALKALCDICRGSLTPHINSFGALLGKVASMQPEQQVKVIEAISSVLQALPPHEALPPVLAIAEPMVSKLEQCIAAAAQAPAAARILAMKQLEALTACADGLTPSDEDMFDLEPEKSAGTVAAMETVRQDPRMMALRERMISALSRAIGIWSMDSEMGSTFSAFMKAMTAPSSSQTLLTLPPPPLLRLVALAAQRQCTALWPSLASTLIFRMAPTPGIFRKNRSQDIVDKEEAEKQAALQMVAETLHILIGVIAPMLLDQGGLHANPDVAESFFKFATAVVFKFPLAFVKNPHESQSACMRMAILALNCQEQFTLRHAIELLSNILYTSRHAPAVSDAFQPIVLVYGREILQAVIFGAAIHCPRSTIPNFAELLVALVTRVTDQTRSWLIEILADPSFPGGKATPAAKKKFQDSLMRIRTPMKMKEALNEFALVCRGLAGTTYGNAKVL